MMLQNRIKEEKQCNNISCPRGGFKENLFLDSNVHHFSHIKKLEYFACNFRGNVYCRKDFISKPCSRFSDNDSFYFAIFPSAK